MLVQNVHHVNTELQLERVGIYKLTEHDTRADYSAVLVVFDHYQVGS
jgi:hypothetical protein